MAVGSDQYIAETKFRVPLNVKICVRSWILKLLALVLTLQEAYSSCNHFRAQDKGPGSLKTSLTAVELKIEAATHWHMFILLSQNAMSTISAR